MCSHCVGDSNSEGPLTDLTRADGKRHESGGSPHGGGRGGGGRGGGAGGEADILEETSDKVQVLSH